MKSAITILLLLATTRVSAGVTDYAYARPIVLAGDGAVQRVSVPQDVYEVSVVADLGDLRIFDGKGEELPYTLQRPPASKSASEWQDLPVFAWPETPPSEDAAKVDIELGEGGAVVAVHGAKSEQDVQRHLIDATSFRDPISEIEMTWPDNTAPFVATLRIEASDDLGVWRVAANNASLAALESDGHRVKVDRIGVGGVRAKYLRVSQAAGSAPLAITHVRARSEGLSAVRRDWKSVAGKPVDAVIEFDVGGRFPIDRVEIERTAQSFLDELVISSRADARARWRQHGRRSFYRVSVDGHVVTSEPLAVDRTTDRHWRAERSGEALDSDIRLRIGWIPHTLAFVALGSPPYTLAYGRAGGTPRSWPLDEIRKRLAAGERLDELPEAALGERMDAGGVRRLTPPPAPIDWQTVTLWAVLVLGVLAVAALAIRLVRSSRGNRESP